VEEPQAAAARAAGQGAVLGPGRRPSPSGVRKGGKSPSSKQSSKAAAAEAAGRAYTHKQALAHGVKDGCIDSSMSSGAAASMVM